MRRASHRSFDSLPARPVPLTFADDRSWHGVLMTTTSIVPYFSKSWRMCFSVTRSMSCGRDVVSELWCREAIDLATGSSSTSMCCRTWTCCCLIASADMFAPEQRFSDTMPVVDMACMCFTEWDTFSVQVDVSSSMVCNFSKTGQTTCGSGGPHPNSTTILKNLTLRVKFGRTYANNYKRGQQTKEHGKQEKILNIKEYQARNIKY